MSKYKVTNKGKIAIAVLLIVVIVAFAALLTGGNKNVNSVEDTESTKKTVDVVIEEPLESEEEILTGPVVEASSEIVTGGSVDQEEDLSDIDQVEMDRNEKISKIVVYFSPDSAIIDEEFETELLEFVGESLLFKDNNIVVEGNINGYPYFKDSTFGSKLSEKRAQMVLNYLIENGIEENRIELISNGSSKPLEKEGDIEKLFMNRRVDVYFEKYGVDK